MESGIPDLTSWTSQCISEGFVAHGIGDSDLTLFITTQLKAKFFSR